MNSHEIIWNELHGEAFTSDHLESLSTNEIKAMFLHKNNSLLNEYAYLSVLQHSAWGIDFNLPRGISRTLLQFKLPLYNGKGISWSEKNLNPGKIWASEDSLDLDKIEMITAAISYMKANKKPIPPVVVWLIKNESKYNFIQHDGHHRTYVCYQLGLQVPAIVLEYWIENRENPILQKKLHYLRINTYVKDLPVVKRTFSE